jgi:cell division septum initiation protein DivIVA
MEGSLPEQLRKLPRSFYGCDRSAVRDLLEQAQKTIDDLNAKLVEFEGRPDPEIIQKSILAAEKTAAEIRLNAENDAISMIEDAKQRVAAIEEEHRAVISGLLNEMEQLTISKQEFVSKFRDLLKGYLAELDANAPADSVRIPTIHGREVL